MFNKKKKYPPGVIPYFPDYRNIYRRSKKM